MKRYAAFLRGINVSGQKIIKMELLRELFNVPGFKNVITYIQSGNVVFDAKEADGETIRQKVEKLLHKGLGYEVTALTRSIDEIKAIIDQNPVPHYIDDSKRRLYVTFLAGLPEPEKIAGLQEYLLEGEEVVVQGKEAYFLTPAYGNTKLSNTFIEKKLGLSATTRNWATVNKIIDL